MTRLTWDSSGERLFEVGIDRGVFFPSSGLGIPWLGLSSLEEGADEGNFDVRYYDGQQYRSRKSGESYAATLEALTYPQEFEPYSGYSDDLFAHQRRRPFGFSYRTLVGDDISGVDHGYKIHIVYNVVAQPNAKSFQSLGSDSDPIFGWTLTSSPVHVPYAKPTAHLIIDSRKVYPWVLAEVENYIYGTDNTESKLPTPEDLIEIFQAGSILRVDVRSDLTAKIKGPSGSVIDNGNGTMTVKWPSVELVGDGVYRISSL